MNNSRFQRSIGVAQGAFTTALLLHFEWIKVSPGQQCVLGVLMLAFAFLFERSDSSEVQP